MENSCISVSDQGRGVSKGIGRGRVSERGEKAESKKPHVQPALNTEQQRSMEAQRHKLPPQPHSDSLPSPTQIPSSCPLEFEDCSAFYIKTLNDFYKVKWHNNPLCPKIHKYKKMQFPYTTWQVTGNGAQSSSGLSPNTQQPKPFKQKNKQKQQNKRELTKSHAN